MTSPTIEQLNAMSEEEAVEATTGVEEHPEGYDGPCNCNLCLSYAGEFDDEG